MNKYFNRFLAFGALSLVLTACSENTWNDKLDGFEVPSKDPAQTVSYTMTAADFTQLGKLKAAQAIAAGDPAHGIPDYSAEFAAAMAGGYFTPEIPAETYIPLFLAQPTCQYFSLPEGSAIKVTYRTTESQPECVVGALNAKQYKVTTEDYQKVWDSEENYCEAFAPSKTAAKNLPAVLKSAFPDAATGEYVIVNYKQSQTDPVFSATPDPGPTFQPSAVLGNLTKGSSIDIKGTVMAVSTQGPIVADAAGSVFVYKPTNNADLQIGDQVAISSTVDSYNYAFQIKSGSSPEVVGKAASVTYPAPKTWTGAEIDKFVADAMASGATPVSPIYSKISGTVKVSGNYINVTLDGTTVQLSPYGVGTTAKALMTDGANLTFEGYVMAIASKGKYLNMVVTKVGDTKVESIASVRNSIKPLAVTVASETLNAIYYYDGSAWVSPSDMVVLNHADYQAMNQSYDNLSGSAPQTYLPIFLKQKYPYAQKDQIVYIVYTYYNGSANVTRCDQCVFDGSDWTVGYNNTTYVTSQFVKRGGKWSYSPDIVITLPAGRNQETSTLYYQACVDWVKNHVEGGANYVTSYGNNDYYTGASAYQGNVDLRPDKAIAQYAEGYAGMSDDEIVALMKERFEKQVLPAVLAELHPDAAPTASGIEPLCTVDFFYYNGTTNPAQIVYRITAKGVFTYESSKW